MPPKAGRGEYIETDTGNKVSRRAQVLGTQRIIVGGKSVIQADVCIRGDLFRQPQQQQQQQQQQSQSGEAGAATSTSTSTSTAPSVAVSIGRYTYLSRSCLLRPPSRLYHGSFSYFPLKIGDHVFIGERAVVEAANVGSHVHIGANAVIGSMAIIKDLVVVLDNAVVPPGMVIPSFSVVGGAPARVVGEVGEGYGLEGAEGGMARERYRMVGR
ncbi:Trimeric LpxA-like protein [Ascosphaera apis ARSEF 7405]|uniref:Dynactin subunit 5 n=1 Tax=Ascosphaera apis ARSEF 7405 TaxID=392613 RepID=A0A166P0H7_9EURO|nr:Trimeric LpxA-like protein [Ascosphaera apis ARSEF 7405]